MGLAQMLTCPLAQMLGMQYGWSSLIAAIQCLALEKCLFLGLARHWKQTGLCLGFHRAPSSCCIYRELVQNCLVICTKHDA